ncbi:amino acid ABC transporter permease [Variovorax sp. WS11]|uniref:amino acid ABC transporter permease n=1 Tax=Variovorax sp. WS11 TaxID=1105204 RepID=UPI000D0E15A3|nr:amino acid ABC transporter permease [Variovorax sp. WS11]NDZ18541.1 amino acid ABC transporter permease [Variovorax sp. WS11]PSL85174.1 amino acid ABC transporter permease [Variovorax sp. WS11]
MIRDFTLTEFWVIASGLWATLLLSGIAFLGGGLAGLGVALARTAPVKALRLAAGVFIDFFQGTPMLLQLFLVFYGLPVFGLKVNVWIAAAVGLTLHAGAFLGEIWRGGIQAVPRGQSEAADALGLTYWSRMRHVVLPQALRMSFAPTVGFLVQLIKGTSLAAVIGFVELSRSGQLVSSITYKPLLAFGLVALCYFAICFPLSRYSARLEKRFAIGN